MSLYYIIDVSFRKLKSKYVIGLSIILYLLANNFIPGLYFKGIVTFILHQGDIIQHTIAFTLGVMLSSILEDYMK